MAVVWTEGMVLTRDDEVMRVLSPLRLTFEPWPIWPLPVLMGDHSVLLVYRTELDRWDYYFDQGQFARYDENTPLDILAEIALPRRQSTRGYFCFAGSCRVRLIDLEVELHGGDFLIVPSVRSHGIELTEEATCKLLVLTRSKKEPDGLDFIS